MPAQGSIAFPLGELRLVTYLFVLGSLIGTAWLLDAPGRIWPWIPVAIAVWGALALAAISTHEGAPAAIQAAISVVLVGGAAYVAGEKFASLGYAGLRWMCLAILAMHALNLALRVLLACWPRPRGQVDSAAGQGDDAQ